MSRESVLIPSLLSKKVIQQLHFTEEGLLVEKAAGTDAVYLKWHDVSGIKIVNNTIKGLYFKVGHQFSILLKTDDGRVHTVDMNSVYGIRRKLYEQLCDDIVHLLFDFHFNNLMNYYLELHRLGQIFTLDGVTVYEDGIRWDNRPKLPWDELEITAYNRYFVIRNRFGIQYRKFLYFDSDWNACMMLDMLRHLISLHNNIPYTKRVRRNDG